MTNRLVAVDDADYRLPAPVLGALSTDMGNPSTSIGAQLNAMNVAYGESSGGQVSVADFGAVPDSSGAVGNGTDNLVAFLAAVTRADAIKGTVVVPGGKWRLSGPLDIKYALVGAGPGYGGDVTSPASMLVFDNDTHGVRLMGRASRLEGLYLRGGTGVDSHGIIPGAIGTVVKDVVVHGFGGHGYFADSTGSLFAEIVNVDHSVADGIMLRANGGNGLHLQGGPDVNALRLVNVNSVGNGGYGVWVDAANRNWVQGHLAANVTGGVWDNGNSNTYDVYIESGAGFSFTLGVNSIYGCLTAPNYARPPIDTTLNPIAWQTWNFQEQNGGKRALYLYDTAEGPAPTTGKTWRMVSGGSVNALQLTNVTDSRVALRFANDGSTTMIGGTIVRPFTIDAQDLGGPALRWRNAFFSGYVRTGAVATGSRPSAATAGAGAQMFDSTLGKPIWSNGTDWVDGVGAVV